MSAGEVANERFFHKRLCLKNATSQNVELIRNLTSSFVSYYRWEWGMGLNCIFSKFLPQQHLIILLKIEDTRDSQLFEGQPKVQTV